MAFNHGKSAALYANGRDLSAYLKSFGVELRAQVNETTTMGKSARVFIPGLLDGMISAEGLFDGTTNAIATVFNAALTSACIVVAWPAGEVAIGDPGFAMRSRGTSYKVRQAVDAVVETSANFQTNDDSDLCISHHPLATRTSAANGTSYDGAASSALGASAILTVTAFSGTSITVKMQDSADNSSWLDISGMAFTAATAGGTSERIVTSTTATIRRYTRAVWSGTFSSATFSVAFSRK